MSQVSDSFPEDIRQIAQTVYERHFVLDPQLYREYDDRRKRLMYEDIFSNLLYLQTAMRFDDNKIFVNYAVWIYQLLCNLMPDLGRERIKEQMLLHYTILQDVLGQSLPAEEAKKAVSQLNLATQATENQARNFAVSQRFTIGKYPEIKKKYLEHLLQHEIREAMSLIDNAVKSGIDLYDIYVEILQEVMYEVGDRWHQRKITIDLEHYCTAVTQTVLAQFYPVIFSTQRKQRRLLACCVGSELHEMGIRMLADLFEYNGWDSIYLGASVPREGILHAIQENEPDLIALSVTMPQHLPLCFEMVAAIREKHGPIKIAVGGRAFQTTDQLWKKWPVDICTENATQLVQWANQEIIGAAERENE